MKRAFGKMTDRLTLVILVFLLLGGLILNLFLPQSIISFAILGIIIIATLYQLKKINLKL